MQQAFTGYFIFSATKYPQFAAKRSVDDAQGRYSHPGLHRLGQPHAVHHMAQTGTTVLKLCIV